MVQQKKGKPVRREEDRKLVATTAANEFMTEVNRRLGERIVEQAIARVMQKEYKTDLEIARATIRELQGEFDKADRRAQVRIGRPKGSPEPLARAAREYQERKWYRVNVGKETVYVTFDSQKELEEFNDAKPYKQYSILFGKTIKGRREVFQEGSQKPATDIIESYVGTASKVAKIRIDPAERYTRTSGGAFEAYARGKGGVTVAERRAGVLEQLALRATKAADELRRKTRGAPKATEAEPIRAYAFTITTKSKKMINIDGLLTDDEIARVESGDPKKVYSILYDMGVENRVKYAGENEGKAANNFVFRIIDEEDITKVEPFVEGGEKPTYEPLKKFAFRIEPVEGRPIKAEAMLTEKEISHIKGRNPNLKYILLHNIMAEGRLLSAGGRIGREATAVIQEYIQMDHKSFRPTTISSRERKIAAAERKKKGVTIAMAIRLNDYGKVNLGADYGNETFEYNTVVFTFKPTAEEMKRYSIYPMKFRQEMRATFADGEKRRAFLKKHSGDMRLYIPPEATRASKRFKRLFGEGAEVSSDTKANDELIRYIIGQYISTHGEGYPSGFSVVSFASVPTKKEKRKMTVSEWKEEVREALPLEEIAQLKRRPPKFERPEIEKRKRYSIDFVSKGRRIKLYTNLTDKEVVAINRIIREGKTDEIYYLLYGRMGKVRKVVEDGAVLADPNAGLNEYMEDGISKVKGINIDRGPAAVERMKRRTVIALAIRLNNYGEVNLGTEHGDEKFRYRGFVLTFQPTADELGEYNDDPLAFRKMIIETMDDRKRRAAFLEKHEGKLSVYIPSESIKASKAFREKFSEGIEYIGDSASKDEVIRTAMMGDVLTAMGINFPSGFRVTGVAGVEVGGTSTQRIEEIRTAFIKKRRREIRISRR